MNAGKTAFLITMTVSCIIIALVMVAGKSPIYAFVFMWLAGLWALELVDWLKS